RVVGSDQASDPEAEDAAVRHRSDFCIGSGDRSSVVSDQAPGSKSAVAVYVTARVRVCDRGARIVETDKPANRKGRIASRHRGGSVGIRHRSAVGADERAHVEIAGHTAAKQADVFYHAADSNGAEQARENKGTR